jgi:hypothetical protein
MGRRHGWGPARLGCPRRGDRRAALFHTLLLSFAAAWTPRSLLSSLFLAYTT